MSKREHQDDSPEKRGSREEDEEEEEEDSDNDDGHSAKRQSSGALLDPASSSSFSFAPAPLSAEGAAEARGALGLGAAFGPGRGKGHGAAAGTPTPATPTPTGATAGTASKGFQDALGFKAPAAGGSLFSMPQGALGGASPFGSGGLLPGASPAAPFGSFGLGAGSFPSLLGGGENSLKSAGTSKPDTKQAGASTSKPAAEASWPTSSGELVGRVDGRPLNRDRQRERD
jgi:hypothetical protein